MKTAIVCILVALLYGCQAVSHYNEGATSPEFAAKKQEIAQLKAAIEADAKEGKIDPAKFVALTEKLQEIQVLAQEHSGKWYDPLLYILGGIIGYPIARLGRRVPILGSILAMGNPNKNKPATA